GIRILDRDGGGAGGAVAVVVGHREGDQVRADVAAIKVGLVQARTGDAARVAAAVVDLGGGDRHVAGRIQLDGDVPADRHRRQLILHRHGGRASLGVAVVVGHGQSHQVGADVGAIKVGLAQAQAGDA